jgi:hypothetical protein
MLDLPPTLRKFLPFSPWLMPGENIKKAETENNTYITYPPFSSGIFFSFLVSSGPIFMGKKKKKPSDRLTK